MEGEVEMIIDSPCRKECGLNEQEVCNGCGRTLGEIREWKDAPDERRVQIREEAAKRKNQGEEE